MNRWRTVGGIAAMTGGCLLIASPSLEWLGVRASGFSRAFTLSESLKGLQRQDLLGPGMTVVPFILGGALAVLVGLATMATASRIGPVVAVVVGAAAGAYAAYLHAALEYAGFAIAGLSSFRVQTTPGAGLVLAIAGAAGVLGGGIVSVVK
jgi:hypothetical protein